MQETTAPGSVVSYSGSEGMFSLFRPMIAVTNGLTLSQVCAITGLEASTVQNWIKRGFVSHPVRKKYYARQLARILIISALRDCMKIDEIGELMRLVNGDTEDERDDIIPEEKLYDELCEVLRRTGECFLPEEALEQTVLEVTAGYVGLAPKSADRLRLALTVMAHAFHSGRLKRQADRYFSRLKTLNQEENEG